MNKVFALKNIAIKDSASGGAFPSIIQALRIIYKNKQLVVYGAAFDDNLVVKHIRAINDADFLRLRGSKYVQSDISGINLSVAKDLSNGYVVLFSGTPCQTYAISYYMEKHNIPTDLLYTVDLLCYGVSRPQLWHDFKLWLERKEGSKLVKFSFRYSQSNWQGYPTMAQFENGKIEVNTFRIRLYTRLFFKRYSFRNSCFSCKFSGVKRFSDITVGDFWGIRKIIPQFPFKKNVSEIIVNTTKGDNIINSLKSLSLTDSNIIIQQSFGENHILYQRSLQEPAKRPVNYESFQAEYESRGFDYVLKKYGAYNLKGYLTHIARVIISKFK